MTPTHAITIDGAAAPGAPVYTASLTRLEHTDSGQTQVQYTATVQPQGGAMRRLDLDPGELHALAAVLGYVHRLPAINHPVTPQPTSRQTPSRARALAQWLGGDVFGAQA